MTTPAERNELRASLAVAVDLLKEAGLLCDDGRKHLTTPEQAKQYLGAANRHALDAVRIMLDARAAMLADWAEED